MTVGASRRMRGYANNDRKERSEFCGMNNEMEPTTTIMVATTTNGLAEAHVCVCRANNVQAGIAQ